MTGCCTPPCNRVVATLWRNRCRLFDRKELPQRGDQQPLTIRPANGEDGAVAVPVLPLRVIPAVWTKGQEGQMDPLAPLGVEPRREVDPLFSAAGWQEAMVDWDG